LRLKLYRAPAMAEAMRRLRAELGPDALILSTRRVADGVEITAALEPPTPPPADPARQQALAWHAVPPAIAARLQAGPLAFALSAALRFTALNLAQGAAPLLLTGPPGAGKSLTCARLATRLVMAGARPMVITADGRRAGAIEQLAAFTRLLGLNLLVASHPATLAQALARREAAAPVLIDAPGIDAFDPAQRDEMTALADAANAIPALVLPAGLDPAEAADLATAHAATGAKLLVATRLDSARRLGGVLAAAGTGLKLAEAGIGPGAADGLVPMTPELLAARLLRIPARLETAS
jgi:flagellar biosynthesis protein FlhF